MIVSLAELLILGLIVDWAFRKMTIPGLVGMLFLGVLAGPYVLGWVNPGLLEISYDFRLLALIVILLRAGLELSKETLNRVGGRVVLLSAVPAVIEGAAITVLGPPLLGLGYMESAILGAILAAVSPAVVVPLMIRFMERGMGSEKGIPTMVLAASSLDDVFVIVIYSVLIGIYTGSSANIAWQLAGIPISILLGVGVGLVAGGLLYRLFHRFDPRATKRVLIVLALSVLFVRGEYLLEPWVPFAALLAVMATGFIILEKDEHIAHEISAKLGKIWIFAEIVLFTMVGAQVDLGVAFKAGLAGAVIIFLGLVARSIGTYGCLLGSDLTFPERMFVVVSYLPKATVQAAIGGAPLAAMALVGMDQGPGEIILAVAVLSIVLTAPLGAWGISILGERTLKVGPEHIHDARDAIVESQGREEN
ncbi:MAG: cation:proton antiporter [Proteobacteria bacterium]|nr:cation:proton antiporter [Pseudomonadota bacterium]MDA1022171.1 cation:proton antiporter [Pseudomonadota bacterium]